MIEDLPEPSVQQLLSQCSNRSMPRDSTQTQSTQLFSRYGSDAIDHLNQARIEKSLLTPTDAFGKIDGQDTKLTDVSNKRARVGSFEEDTCPRDSQHSTDNMEGITENRRSIDGDDDVELSLSCQKELQTDLLPHANQTEPKFTQEAAVVERLLNSEDLDDPYKSQDDREAFVVQTWLKETSRAHEDDACASSKENIDSQDSVLSH